MTITIIKKSNKKIKSNKKQEKLSSALRQNLHRRKTITKNQRDTLISKEKEHVEND